MADAFGFLRLVATSAGTKYQNRPIAKATSNIAILTIPPESIGVMRPTVRWNITLFLAARVNLSGWLALQAGQHLRRLLHLLKRC